MSIEAKCSICGDYSGLRINFGENYGEEAEFHANYRCKRCAKAGATDEC